MKKIIILMIVAAIGWQAYAKYQHRVADSLVSVAEEHPPAMLRPSATPANYRCDGRTYCSQMTSCEEATWFLRNCPDTKMDGDNDGIPCEKQWCK